MLRFSTAGAVALDWRERTAAKLAAAEPARRSGPKAPKDSYGLAALFRAEGLPELRPEFVFHPVRGWQFDYADVPHLIAIEIEGGIWRQGGGAHSHPTAILRDMEKYNAATLLGWRVLRYTPADAGFAVRDVRLLLADER
jgi:hypothetical protein